MGTQRTNAMVKWRSYGTLVAKSN